jgi:hypothetical protein
MQFCSHPPEGKLATVWRLIAKCHFEAIDDVDKLSFDLPVTTFE